MPDLPDGESVEIKGSAAKPYLLKNTGGVYSCTCPAWRNQSIGIERRTCKHLRKYRGDEAEAKRIGSAVAPRPEPATGETSTAPGLLLAQTWDSDANLADWWMSEKLDGVRAYWDGQQFLSRREIGSSLRIGSSSICPRPHWTENCGWPARVFSGPSASCGGKTRATYGANWRSSCSMRRRSMTSSNSG